LSDESGTSRIGIDAPVVRGKIIKGQKRSFLLARTTSSLGRVGSLIDGSLPTGDSLGQIWHIGASDGNLGGDPFGEVSHRLYRSYQGRDDVSLRGKQEVVLERVMSEKVEKILVVVSTGSGKSLMWIMPCIIGRGGGVTVVVVPLKSSMGGIKKDCDEMGLGCLV
jgi:hypothetical protein